MAREPFVVNVLRVVTIDDEPLARERVSALARETPGLALVGEARNGLEALDVITRLEPDLIFIDVEMPELDGFGVIAALEVSRAPAVVFITAYEQYALQAFEVDAVDYLQKPVTRARFAAAVARAQDRVGQAETQWRGVVAGAAAAGRARGHRTRFVVRRGNRHHFIPVSHVDWIDAADNYLQLHVGARTHLARGTMKQAEDELDPAHFLRVHRSAIVAIDRIATVESSDAGTWDITLSNGTSVHSSRPYAARVRELLR
ncbi:MAG: LytTR family DNA-binding domain-containing protein [Gemmatimonadaceae bacterium]